MLNLPESFFFFLPYSSQYSVVLKSLGLFIGGFKFLEFIRFQISEIVILQLMPGVYFTFAFLFFGILFFFSYQYIKLIRGNDWIKKLGVKGLLRFVYRRIVQSIFFYIGIGFFAFFTQIIPVTFESFSYITSSTVANLWELGEFIGLETTLSFLVYIFTQLPFFLIGPDYSFFQFIISPTYLRDSLFAISLAAGLLTPTLDVSTQINFILIGIGFYLLISIFVEKIIIRRRISQT